MASSASTVLRQELMTASENDGTWGPKTNINLGILESAITGVVTISDTSGTVTLTNVDYTNDQAKKAILVCNATLVGNLIIVIPNASKTYKLVNATSGSFTVSIKTSSGTAKTVTQSTVAELRCDGSNNVTFITPMVNPTTGAPATASGAAASAVSVTPSGNLSSTDAQSALTELQTDIDNRQPLDSDLTAIAALTATKGTMIVGNGSAWTSQAVGSDYQIPMALAAQSTGIKYTFAHPVGIIQAYPGSSAPDGWLMCYGQAVSRTTYAALFSVCGTIYGSGDGSTTFNVPDLRGRVIAGKDNMGGTSADRLTGLSGGIDGDTLANTGGGQTHTHTFSDSATTSTRNDQGLGGSGSGSTIFGTTSHSHSVTVSGTTSSNSSIQPTIILNYIIWAAA